MNDDQARPEDAPRGGGSHSRNIREADLQELPVRIGEVIDDKYRIDRLVGVGGMGLVMAAHDVALDRPVALKFLHGLSASTLEANSRFKREARAMAKLHSEHVVRVLDVGTLPSGEPYMVMEYLEGIDLAQLVKTRGFLPVPEAVDYILAACEAVAEAHALGIIHRDLKPSNLYLSRTLDGTSKLKLLDFGIAKISTDASEYEISFTTTTALLGSPVYMSPEQLQCSRDADARADIWSLGAIIYRLISGRPPFVATTMPQICAMILTNTPQPLGEIVGDVPPTLDAVVMRCLEKSADRRFENVGELARALAPFGTGKMLQSVERALAIVQARAGVPPVDPVSGGYTPPLHASRIVPPEPRPSVSLSMTGVRDPLGSRTLLVVSLLLSIALGFGLGLLLWFRGRTGPSAEDSPYGVAGTQAPQEVVAASAPAATTAQAPPTPIVPVTALPTAASPPPTQSTNPAITVPVSALPTAPATTTPAAHPPRWRPPRSHEPGPSVAVAPAPVPAPAPAPAPPAPAGDNSEFGGRK